MLIGHRGSSANAPENTLPAFERAWLDGAGAVECDVRLTADGVPVLCHDDSLLRTAGVDREVESLLGPDLQQLDVGAWKGAEWAGTRIPSLAQALAWSADRLPLVIELKTAANPERIAIAVANAIRESAGRVRVCSSFSLDVLDALRQAAPDLPRALIAADSAAGALDLATRLGATELYLAADACDEPGTDLADCPLPVLVWTVDDPARARRLLERGSAGIVSNAPSALAQLFRQWGQA